MLLNFLTEGEIEDIVNEFHKGVCGGHHGWRVIAYKILRAGYYWPSLFSDVNCMVRACVECQMFARKKSCNPSHSCLLKQSFNNGVLISLVKSTRIQVGNINGS